VARESFLWLRFSHILSLTVLQTAPQLTGYLEEAMTLEPKITCLMTVSLKQFVWQNPDQERTNQNAQMYLKIIMPQNRSCYFFLLHLID